MRESQLHPIELKKPDPIQGCSSKATAAATDNNNNNNIK